MPNNPGTISNLNGKLLDLLDRVEYRRITSSEDMEDVARIRHKAYSVNQLIKLDGSLLIDEVDTDSHAYILGVYVDEQLVSTLRLNLVTPEHRVSLSRKIFPREIDAFLDAGMTIIDPTRLAADPDVVRTMPGLPYLTIRLACLASEYFNADRVLQSVDASHVAFYRKLFFSDVLTDPLEKNENYNVNLTLMSIRGKVMLPKIYERFPAFNSDPFERRLMFGERESKASFPLAIRPTARRLLQQPGQSFRN